MKRVFSLFLLFISCNLCFQLTAQESKQLQVDVQASHAQLIGKTPPLRDLVPLPRTSLLKKKANKSRKMVPNFLGRRNFEPTNPNGLPNGPDPVRQSQLGQENLFPVAPIVDIEGIGPDIAGAGVPDVCGEAGRDHYIQMVNASWFQIFDKEGQAISNPIAANTLWASIGFQSAGDPIILYDQEFDRWIITEFPFGNQL
ncbi:MAG: hypothetical protein AAF985_26645, partial [Bacteroidota bacterium]